MTNIENDIILKFKKLEDSLINIDNNLINEEFNKLSNSEQLYIFAKKLIISNEDFNNQIEYDKLKKQNNKLTKECSKINNLKLKNKIALEDAYAFEYKYNKSKTYCSELENKIYILTQENEKSKTYCTELENKIYILTQENKKSKTYCSELENKIYILTNEYENSKKHCNELEDIILEDTYVFNLKYSKLNNQIEQLKTQINSIKKLINKKIDLK